MAGDGDMRRQAVTQAAGAGGSVRLTRQEWLRRLKCDLGLEPGAAGFDRAFALHVSELLGEHGFPHVAEAVRGSVRDLLAERSDRTEFDSLVDVAIRLLVEHDET